ncbi:MAG: GNAT family N-acetyltransferase, partial [Chloroflexi bacterium]|nr:GNAT family N-acetyltransferase [Chloroflexota bacterium]
MDPQPIVLSGSRVRLEPIQPRHASDLYQVGRDEVIWRHLTTPPFGSLGDAENWVQMCVNRMADGSRVQFAVVLPDENKAIGSTGYLDIDRTNRTLEVGMTWYGLDYQRTFVNTECKYTLLKHAFDDQGARRVCIKTDVNNTRSRRAIERIGGVQEGILRNHRINRDGSNRDSVYY